jgi:hypothetical protein
MHKTLFIFSDDFGELVLLRLLLFKQPVHAFLALPERLIKHVELTNTTRLPYHDVEDLKKHIEDIGPTQVMLFSAYLLAPNGLLPFPEFYSFLDYLDKKGVQVCTSDPFMRYYDQLEYDFEAEDFYPKVRNILKAISERVAAYTHVYPVPMQSTATLCQSFSNTATRYVKPEASINPRWTFIMASQDFLLLQKEHEHRYHDVLIPLLRTLINDHDIQVTLLFPEEFPRILRPELAEVQDITFLSYCNMDIFEQMIAQSDMMIYWNLFSASTLLCRLYNKPTVFLHKGHMEKLFPGYYEYAKRAWFPIADPAILAIDNTFIPKVFKLMDDKHASIFQPYYELDAPANIFSHKAETV